MRLHTAHQQRQTLRREGLDHRAPSFLQSPNTLLQRFILAFPFTLSLRARLLLICGRRHGGWEHSRRRYDWRRHDGHKLVLLLDRSTGGGRSELRSSPQDPVFLLELGYSPFEVAELGFPPIARVLGCDPVAVRPGFLALFGRGGGFCGFGRVGRGGGGCACAFAGWLVLVFVVVVVGVRR